MVRSPGGPRASLGVPGKSGGAWGVPEGSWGILGDPQRVPRGFQKLGDPQFCSLSRDCRHFIFQFANVQNLNKTLLDLIDCAMVLPISI